MPLYNPFGGGAAPAWQNFKPEFRTSPSQLFHSILATVLDNSGVVSTNVGTAPSSGSISTLYDAVRKSAFWQGQAGVASNSDQQLGFTINPAGPTIIRSAQGFDFNDGLYEPLFPNPTLNIFCVEMLGAFLSAQIDPDPDVGYGISSASWAGAGPLAATSRAIGISRSAFGDLWSLTCADGVGNAATRSGAADGNVHVFRIEWEVIAGIPTARLYVDNILQITTTNRVPNPNTLSTIVNRLGFRKTAAIADAYIQWYATIMYWK